MKIRTGRFDFLFDIDDCKDLWLITAPWLLKFNFIAVYLLWSSLLKLRIRFLRINVYKRVFGNYSTFLDLELLPKLKLPGFYILVFAFLLITQDLNKIQKNPKHPFVDIVWNEWKMSSKKKKFCGSWSSSKFSIFYTNNLLPRKQRYHILGIIFCITY